MVDAVRPDPTNARHDGSDFGRVYRRKAGFIRRCGRVIAFEVGAGCHLEVREDSSGTAVGQYLRSSQGVVAVQASRALHQEQNVVCEQ